MGASPTIPDSVSRHSHQQYDPPEGQLNSHPEFPSLKAPCFRENLGSGDEHDIQAKNLSERSQDSVDRRDGVESFSKALWKTRQHVRIKGRPHQQVNHHQIQDQDDSLANAMRYETLGPSQERAEDQSNAHRDLNRKIQIRAITSMSAEKTFHSAHFLVYAGRDIATGTVQRLLILASWCSGDTQA
jgi:hypothetical protein